MNLNEKPISDTKLWSFITLAGNAIGLNMFFLLACLPVVTMGPALCGLFSGVRFLIRGESWFAGFREGFRKHFWRATIAGLLCNVAFVFLVLNLNSAISFCMDTGNISPIFTYAIPILPVLMLFGGLWPLNIYIGYNTSDWLKNAVNLCFQAPLQVLATGALLVLPAALIIYLTNIAFYGAIVILGIYYSLAAFVATILLKDVLIRYLTQFREENNDEGENNYEQ